MVSFLQNHIKKLKDLLDDINFKDIKLIIEALEQTVKKKSKIYIIGNGGSCATALHMANDLGVGLRRREIKNFNIVSLCDNMAATTAVANDIGFENIFYMQLKDLLTKDDVIIAISCSGNSSNITKAIKYAKEVGATVVGVTGFDGGELKRRCDISFHIQTLKDEYGLVEDMHMILDHMIYSYYEQGNKRC